MEEKLFLHSHYYPSLKLSKTLLSRFFTILNKYLKFLTASKHPTLLTYLSTSSLHHVWLWDLDYKESWALKNGCFWTVVWEKTSESPMGCKEIQPVHSKGHQSWVFIGKSDVKAETPVLWPPHAKSWLIRKDPDARKDWGQEEKGTTEDEVAGWHHWLDGRESEWTPGDRKSVV